MAREGQGGPVGKGGRAAERQARLAKALRDNLRKRKGQARGREAEADGDRSDRPAAGAQAQRSSGDEGAGGA